MEPFSSGRTNRSGPRASQGTPGLPAWIGVRRSSMRTLVVGAALFACGAAGDNAHNRCPARTPPATRSRPSRRGFDVCRFRRSILSRRCRSAVAGRTLPAAGSGDAGRVCGRDRTKFVRHPTFSWYAAAMAVRRAVGALYAVLLAIAAISAGCADDARPTAGNAGADGAAAAAASRPSEAGGFDGDATGAKTDAGEGNDEAA